MGRKKKTESLTSPQGGNRGCICEDGTYSKECCDGTLQAQGIGALQQHTISNVTNTNVERTITVARG
jgi:hypothetical protein